MAERPLSPHLMLYRFGYTMSLSILHRLTGLALSFCLMAFVFWLLGLAGGREAYARTLAVLSLPPFKLVYAFGLIALVYHFCNGIRHLAWDAGWGFEKPQARRSAVAVVIATVVLGAVCLYLAFSRVSP